MDLGFKFEIGSIVKPFGTPELPDEDDYAVEREQRFIIVERRLQECPGGIQRHYVGRAISRSGGAARDHIVFNEIELIQSGPFPAPVPTETRLADARARREKAASDAASGNVTKSD